MKAALHCFDVGLTNVLTRIGAFADKSGHSAYLVGGLVRDLRWLELGMLESLSVYDVDLMFVGADLRFFSELESHWKEIVPNSPSVRRFLIFEHYLTARVEFEDSIVEGVHHLDFSLARKEIYPDPGGRPIIEEGTFNQDLLRRDFSINALAIGLTPDRYSTVYDICNGNSDLREKNLIILHNRSFVDDPARLLRASRFISRFGLHMDARTENAFKEAIASDFLKTLPKERLFSELLKLLNEQDLHSVVELANNLGVLQSFFRSLGLEPAIPDLDSFKIHCSGIGRVSKDNLVACIFEKFSNQQLESVLKGAGFGKRVKKDILTRHKMINAIS